MLLVIVPSPVRAPNQSTPGFHTACTACQSWPRLGTTISVTSLMPALRAAAAIMRMLRTDSLSRSPAPANSASPRASPGSSAASALTGTCAS